MNVVKTISEVVKKSLVWFLHASLIKKIVTLAVFLVVVWLLITRIFTQANRTQQYQTAQAEKGTLITTVTASGSISIGNNVSIISSATGVVTAVYVHNGDTVSQGDKIAEITLDQNAQQRQAAAYANYLAAQNTLNAAKAKMNSLQSALFKANQAFVTDRGVENPSIDQKNDPRYIEENADWLQAESDYNNQQGVIQAAEASLTSAYLSYQQISSTITAPASGTITSFSLSVGLPLTATSTSSNTTNNSSNSSNTSSTESLGTISIPGSSLQAVINLSEIDVTHVAVGQRVTLTLDAFPGKTFTGRVTAINTNGTVSSGVTTYPTTITIDSVIPTIYPNMAVNATIQTAVKDNVLLIPSSAIQSQNGETNVRVLRNGQVNVIPVEVGDSSDTQVEITSGLTEGDTVITGSQIQTSNSTRTGNSPFGGGGFGGLRGGGFGGGNRQVIIQR